MEPLPVWNRAFGGSSTPDQLPALPRLILPHKPRIVVYYCGDNDLANPAAPFEGPVKGFSDFVAALRKDEPEARVVYVSIKPSPSRAASWPNALKANAAIKELCGKTPGLTYVDVATPMLDKDGAPRPELFGPDHLHMKPEGYVIWTATLKPVLEQLWAQVQKEEKAQKAPVAK
jgi:lysophospholipase L1-like esterase